jgi:hypothetical protein
MLERLLVTQVINPGQTVVTPHGLRNGPFSVKPRLMACLTANCTLTALDTSSVSVRNDGSVPVAAQVWLMVRHSILGGVGQETIELCSADQFRDLVARVEALETSLSALEAGAANGYGAHAQGTPVPLLVPTGTVVLVPMPALVAGDQLPNDGRWQVSGGVLLYDGSLSGRYEVHCPIAFRSSEAALRNYGFEVVEGLNLATGAPTRRDSTTIFNLDRQGTLSDTTAMPGGNLVLQPTGGQIGIFSQSTATNPTLTFGEVSLDVAAVVQKYLTGIGLL